MKRMKWLIAVLFCAVLCMIATVSLANGPTDPNREAVLQEERIINRTKTGPLRNGGSYILNKDAVNLTPIQAPALGETAEWSIVCSNGSSTVRSMIASLMMKDTDEDYSTVYRKDEIVDSFSCEIISAGEYSFSVFVTFSDGKGYYNEVVFTIEDDDSHTSLTEKVEQLVSENKGKDDWETALNLHDWLTNHAYYDGNYEYYGAEGVLLRGYGVCDSYSKAYLLLCRAAGIPVSRVTGWAGESHAWNAIQINGEWYLVDVTWDDPYTGGTEAISGYECHDYFCLNDDLMNLDHRNDKTLFNTPCTALDANWLLRNATWNQLGDAIVKIEGGYWKGTDYYSKMILAKLNEGEQNFTVPCNDVFYGDYSDDDGNVQYINYDADEPDAIRGWTLLAYSFSQKSFTLADNSSMKLSVTYDRTNNQFVCEPAEVIVDSGKCGNDLNWVLTEAGLLRITGTGAMTDNPWSTKYSTSILQVEILDGVTSIFRGAFAGCSNLASIELPDEMATIGDGAFYGCTSLTEITIPNGITAIGIQAFSGCASLTSAILPDSLISIDQKAFEGCTGLTGITLPAQVASVSNNAFIGCPATRYAAAESEAAKALSKANYPFRVEGDPYDLIYQFTGETISGTELSNCDTDVTAVDIPANVTSLAKYAFQDCASLTEINFPDGLLNIGNSAFTGCTGLTEITIPDGVTSIGSAVFGGRQVMVYATLNSQGAKALSKANYSFRVPGTNWNRRYVYTGDEITGEELTGCDQDVTSFVIPDEITILGYDAFRDCTLLTNVQIPDSVEEIKDCAFSTCTSLVNLTIPNKVTTIGVSAFENCSNLVSLTLPQRMSSIGAFAFEKCSKLTDIEIPDGLTTIEGHLFEKCSSLVSLTIPNGVTAIGTNAFDSCTNLTSLTIPASVQSINGAAFGGCSKLTLRVFEDSFAHTYAVDRNIPFELIASEDTLRLSSGLKTIEPYAFEGINCKVVIIPDSCESIGKMAFANCQNLIRVVVPARTEIADDAFYGCSAELIIERK